jgi:hypothetical protein
MRLLTYFQWKYLIVVVILLYVLFWLLDPNEAKQVLWGAISIINSLITPLFYLSSLSTF